MCTYNPVQLHGAQSTGKKFSYLSVPHRYLSPFGDQFEILVRPRHPDLPPKEELEEPG